MGVISVKPAALAVVLMGFSLATPAISQEVTLRMKGGGFSVSGELVNTDGASYTINSATLGTMTLDAERFECLGNGCPAGRQPTTQQIPSTVRSSAVDTSTSGRITLVGSTAIGASLMPNLVAGYAASIGGRVVDESGGRSGTTLVLRDYRDDEIGRIDLRSQENENPFEALRTRRAQIAMSSRPISNEEAGALLSAGMGDLTSRESEHVVAVDGVQVVVAPENPAVSVSVKDLGRIFSGQVSDWSQLGLPPGRINVYAPVGTDGSWDAFESLVLKPTRARLGGAVQRQSDQAQLLQMVARDPQAIGFVGAATRHSLRALNIEDSCGLITPPSLFSMKTEEYPLARRLFLYTPGQPREPLARDLLEYSLSDDAQLVVRQSDLINQLPDALGIQDQGSRIAYALNAPGEDFNLELMRELISEIRGAERLTSTFRFRVGSFELDSKALDDVKRLSAILQEEAKYNNIQVTLLGFADSTGGFDVNKGLSEARARAVQQALAQTMGSQGSGVTVQSEGFGELAPVSCNDTGDGRQLNRRVEVWVR
ncbi:MAG: substrate-binding domain-containing protein [Rhodobacteraceae bacterium]|nr:substrate-binding domain-containing protein [Paracoccaceae bacterium]